MAFPKTASNYAWTLADVNALAQSVSFSSIVGHGIVAPGTSTGSTTFTGATVWIIKNTGSVNVHINFDAAATTSHFYLMPNEEIQINLDADAIHYITASGTGALSILAGVGKTSIYTSFSSTTANSGNGASATVVTDQADSWIIINRGTGNVHITWDEAASTSKFMLQPGEKLVIDFSNTTDFRAWGIGAAQSLCVLALTYNPNPS